MKDFCSLGVVLAHWATVIVSIVAHWDTAHWAIVIATVVALIALCTYRSNNSIRKWELIKQIFDIFMKDDQYKFYKKIQNGEQINLENEDENNY
jgi:O-antigen/teichoic acid export membrane protein